MQNPLWKAVRKEVQCPIPERGQGASQGPAYQAGEGDHRGHQPWSQRPTRVAGGSKWAEKAGTLQMETIPSPWDSPICSYRPGIFLDFSLTSQKPTRKHSLPDLPPGRSILFSGSHLTAAHNLVHLRNLTLTAPPHRAAVQSLQAGIPRYLRFQEAHHKS